MVGPLTSTCPCLPSPMGVPNKATSASRDACGSAEGHGCPGEQDPSSSRAAIPASLRRGPSSHHTGPSPSQTAVGVHAKACPEGTTETERSMSNNDIVGSIPAQTEEIDNRLIADQGNGELREQPFRMHWIEQVEEERAVSSVAASTRNELVARLAEFDATFVVVELVDNGRVVASVLTTAADVVRWQRFRVRSSDCPKHLKRPFRSSAGRCNSRRKSGRGPQPAAIRSSQNRRPSRWEVSACAPSSRARRPHCSHRSMRS